MRWWLRKQWLRLKLYAAENYQNEAESLIIWYAVAFASGAAFYFALPLELSAWVIVGYLEAVLLLLWLTRRRAVQAPDVCRGIFARAEHGQGRCDVPCPQFGI